MSSNEEQALVMSTSRTTIPGVFTAADEVFMVTVTIRLIKLSHRNPPFKVQFSVIWLCVGLHWPLVEA